MVSTGFSRTKKHIFHFLNFKEIIKTKNIRNYGSFPNPDLKHVLTDDYHHSPPILALNAIPGTQRLLSAEAPTCPAQRVPCLKS